MSTVLRENLRPHMLKRSSNEGPRRSMTMMLYSPDHSKLSNTFGCTVVNVGNALVDHTGILQ